MDHLLINYRSHSSFNESLFRNELSHVLQNLIDEDKRYDGFKDTFIKILNLRAPMKKNIVSGNNAPFMNHTLSHAFMHRSKFKNKFNKNPTEENNKALKRQRNYCVSVLRKEKKKYYNNLDLAIFDDNRIFWQKSLPNDIILKENGAIISNKNEIAEKLNNVFIEVVDKLTIERHLPGDIQTEILQENIDRYKNHPSIIYRKCWA